MIITFDNSIITTSIFGDSNAIETSCSLSMNDVILNMNPINEYTSLLLQFLRLPYPSTTSPNTQKCILNFDGTQGSTNFIEEINPSANIDFYNTQIDTSWKKFGTGSLAISDESDNYSYLAVSVPSVTQFTLHGYFIISNESELDTPISFLLYGSHAVSFAVTGSNYPYLEDIIGYEDQTLPIATIYISGYDPDVGWIEFEHFISEIDLHTEYHVAIINENNAISVYLNGIKMGTYNIPGTDAFFNEIVLFPEKDANIDAVELTTQILWRHNFTIPTSAPSFQGSLNYEISNDCSLIYLSNTINDSFADIINIYGSCCIEGNGLTNSIAIKDLNIKNVDGETNKYYFLNFLVDSNFPLILSSDLNQIIGNNIGNNKLFFDSLGLYKISGLVDLSNTKLVNCIASGGATFNSLLSKGNIDGGGNVGWYFGDDPGPDPEPTSSFIPKIIYIF